MDRLKLKVKKVAFKHPQTKEQGYVARVITNGKAGYENIVEYAGHNTTMHRAEIKMAFELCMEAVAELLRQGYIVDLGPVGKLYPSCSAGWYANEKELLLENIKPSLYYRAGDDISGSVRAAVLQWSKATDDDKDETPSGGTPSDSDDVDNPGGGGSQGGGTSGGDDNGGF